jgi:hypothetical protein
MAQDLAKMLLDSMKASKAKAGRAKSSNAQHLGFDDADQAKVFRAIAAVHPKAVLINDPKWRRPAEVHTERGYLKCAVYPHGSMYRLTESGVRRARAEKLIKG